MGQVKGYELVFDYRRDTMGVRESYRHNGINYILLEGAWYLDGMPAKVRDCIINSKVDEHHPDFVPKNRLDDLIKAREDYRLIPHGRRDEYGQRYRLPDPKRAIRLDKDGNKLPAASFKGKPVVTVTIPLTIGMKWLQKYPWQSEEWKAAYNLRSTVERANSTLKSGTGIDLGDPHKRPARSHAAHSINIALLAAAHNINTLLRFSATAEGINIKKGTMRRQRRAETTMLRGVQPQRDKRKRAA